MIAKSVACGLLVTMACGTTSYSAECPDPPAAMVASVDTLIERTGRIVVAELVPHTASASPGSEKHDFTLDREKEIAPALESRKGDRTVTDLGILRFNVIEDIKGEGHDQVFLAGRIDAVGASGPDVSHDDAFLRDLNAGRIQPNAKCRIELSFEQDAQYLLFIGQSHVKAYEKVEEGDSWLSYVRGKLDQ